MYENIFKKLILNYGHSIQYTKSLPYYQYMALAILHFEYKKTLAQNAQTNPP